MGESAGAGEPSHLNHFEGRGDMRRAWIILIVSILPFSLLACASRADSEAGQEDSDVQAIFEAPSCWALSLSSSLPGAFPEAVFLDTIRIESLGSDQRTWYRAESLFGQEWRDYPFAAWRPLNSDSLLISHPGALEGFTLRADLRAGELRGTVTYFTDVLDQDRDRSADAEAHGRIIECPRGAQTSSG